MSHKRYLRSRARILILLWQKAFWARFPAKGHTMQVLSYINSQYRAYAWWWRLIKQGWPTKHQWMHQQIKGLLDLNIDVVNCTRLPCINLDHDFTCPMCSSCKHFQLSISPSTGTFSRHSSVIPERIVPELLVLAQKTSSLFHWSATSPLVLCCTFLLKQMQLCLQHNVQKT